MKTGIIKIKLLFSFKKLDIFSENLKLFQELYNSNSNIFLEQFLEETVNILKEIEEWMKENDQSKELNFILVKIIPEIILFLNDFLSAQSFDKLSLSKISNFEIIFDIFDQVKIYFFNIKIFY